MSTCDMGYEHPDLVAEPVEAAPVTEAAVQIAEIEAERDVTLARIGAKAGESEAEQRIAALEGKLAGIADTLDRLLPAEPEAVPDPTPVFVEPPAPEPVIDDEAVVPAPIAEPVTKPTRSKSVWW